MLGGGGRGWRSRNHPEMIKIVTFKSKWNQSLQLWPEKEARLREFGIVNKKYPTERYIPWSWTGRLHIVNASILSTFNSNQDLKMFFYKPCKSF